MSGDHNMYCSGNQPDIVERLRETSAEMKSDDIIKLAQKAGFHFHNSSTISARYSEKCFEHFAELISVYEREACAKICEKNAEHCSTKSVLHSVLMANAAAIRERGETK